MAEIQPFRAYRYDTNRVAPSDVLTQPYDKISPAMQERYYEVSPYNLITIEKGRALPGDSPENNVYTRAAEAIDEWIADRILRRDSTPAIYVYSQDFEVPGTRARRERIGFIALTRVEDYDAHVVFRHERTLSAPKADRIELLRQTRAQTGQLFLLYDDPARQIDAWLDDAAARAKPALELRDEYGVTHRLWPLADSAFVSRVQKAMAPKKLVIADGHHRYETALHYRDECRGGESKTDPMAASEFAMATFINTHSRGLLILPTHRTVANLANFDFGRFRKALAPYFDWYSYPFLDGPSREAAYAEFRKDLEGRSHGRRAIGVYAGAGTDGSANKPGPAFYLFALQKGLDLEEVLPDVPEAQRELDVVLLHRLILQKGLGITPEDVASEKNVGYEREMHAAIGAVDASRAQIALLLNPVPVKQVVDIALGGDVMPQKSTDFYPKLLSGIAIYRLEGRISG
ncbi:MAG TPA: DUF1015 domain-containing protein [Candidatus Acidoferrales bacterium]|nr:DUF1015 domain-containing protein [Candidatus Acidoferrales bacterium]